MDRYCRRDSLGGNVTCVVCKQEIDTENEAVWQSEDDDLVHLFCIDALASALLKLRKRNEYGSTVFEILAEKAVQIVNG